MSYLFNKCYFKFAAVADLKQRRGGCEEYPQQLKGFIVGFILNLGNKTFLISFLEIPCSTPSYIFWVFFLNLGRIYFLINFFLGFFGLYIQE